MEAPDLRPSICRNPQPTWSLQLKQQTTSAHRRTESTVAPLLSEDLTLSSYFDFLQKLTQWIGIYEPILLIAAQEDPWLQNIDYPSRQKLPALGRDTDQLAASLLPDPTKPPSIRVSHDTANIPLKTTAQRLGFLYVMEGSTLGGLILAQRLESRLHLSQIGGIHYFNVYRGQTRAKWLQLLDSLNTYCETNPHAYPTILKSALMTFRSYRRTFTAQNSPSL